MKNAKNEQLKNTNKEENENFWNKSFMFEFWETIFRILSKISSFLLIRKIDIVNKHGVHIFKTYRFVDSWVLSNLVICIISPIIL